MEGFRHHDHDGCIARALTGAEAIAEAEGLRLTPVRRRVLEILLEEHRALGAYDILARLQAEGQSAQPPTAYRALDFLTRHGLAHRIERLNAYVACTRHGEAHMAAFMICRICNAVAEIAGAQAGDMLTRAARSAGFVVEACVMEAEGVCPACAEAAP